MVVNIYRREICHSIKSGMSQQKNPRTNQLQTITHSIRTDAIVAWEHCPERIDLP
jgi:hypothetical protein